MAQVLTESVAALRAQMVGDVVTPDHAAYDELRKVWNGDIDRRPAVIARCAGTEDVRAALAFGRAHRLPIAVRCGGHSLPGHSVCDDGIVIDLRTMNRVTVDAERRRAHVEGGAVWSEVDAVTVPLGLAVTGGHVSHTGVGGLTLGGGVGHLHRAFGLSSDNLLSAQIVTADGEVLRASEDENPDLFWAIRGGGGNFGIATEFEFRLHPIPETMLTALLFFAPDQGPELMRLYQEVTAKLPDSVNTILAYMHIPPLPFAPESVHFKPAYAVIAVALDHETGERELKPLRDLGTMVEMVAPMPYLAIQTLFDPLMPHGVTVYLKSSYFNGYTEDAIATIARNTATMPPGTSQMLNLQLGGALGRPADDSTAFAGRKAGFLMMAWGAWEDPGQRPAAVEWARTFADEVAALDRIGTNINLADAESEERLAESYGAKFKRLRELKAKYDPENVFRLNQNIQPA